MACGDETDAKNKQLSICVVPADRDCVCRSSCGVPVRSLVIWRRWDRLVKVVPKTLMGVIEIKVDVNCLLGYSWLECHLPGLMCGKKCVALSRLAKFSNNKEGKKNKNSSYFFDICKFSAIFHLADGPLHLMIEKIVK